MARCIFIGDEASAAGYRLAGLECLTPSAAQVARVFRESRSRAGLIMITAELAAALENESLAVALREQRPPILVVPDIRGHRRPEDPTAMLKRQLGLTE